MGGLTIFRSTLSSPALVLSSTGGRMSPNVLLNSGSEQVFAAASSEAAVTTSNRRGGSRLFSSGGRRALWIGAQPTPEVHRAAPPPAAEAAAAAADREAAPPPPEAPAASPDRADRDSAAPPAGDARPTTKLELAIDSLPGYELVKPIPVVVESLGNKVFVAEVPDLDVSITGTSVSNSLLQLKDQIVRVYEGLRSKRNLDSERARQLGKLESYIVKRRNWF